MDKQSSDQELTFEPSSENTEAISTTENQESVPQRTEAVTPPPEERSVEAKTPVPAPTLPSKKRSKKPFFILLIVLLLIAGYGVAWWFFIDRDSAQNNEQSTTGDWQATEGAEQFNNVLYYAYYENGITYIKSVDLNDSGADKKTLVEFGEKNEENTRDGDHYGQISAPVSISKDGETVLYSTEKGLYEHNLTTDSRDAVFRFEMTTSGPDGERLDKVIVVETNENIRDVENEDFGFRLFGDAVYSYAKNAFGFTERHYEGASVDVFDRDSNSLIDIGSTFTYISDAKSGDLTFAIKKEAQELVDYGLYPRQLLDVTGGSMGVAMFNEPGNTIAATVRLYDDNIGGINYELGGKLVVIDTASGAHQVVKNVGKDTYALAYQSNDTLSVVDSDGKSYVLRQFDKDLNEIGSTDLSKISGISGEVVDADLQLINDKIYIEITTKTDKTFTTYIYNHTDKDFITEFLIAEDADVKVLKHE